MSTASIADKLVSELGDIAELTFEKIDVAEVSSRVKSDQAGAVVVFEGTTRDTFQHRTVTRLEYEAYTKLALKTMLDVFTKARTSPSTSDLIRCAIVHRLGNVPVGETSIIVAVSSPHRKVAFEACELLLEEVKLHAQIWKREWYEGEEESHAQWKSNFPK